MKTIKYGSTTTDREPTDHEQTDCEQRRLAEKGDPKYIFTIPRAILPKPSLSDKITATKSVTKTCKEIIASRSVDLARSDIVFVITEYCHYDPDASLLMMIEGSKQVRLFSCSDHKKLYPNPLGSKGKTIQSQVAPFVYI